MKRSVPRLHLISDRTLCSLDQFPELVRSAVTGGVDAVHLREKDLPGGILLDMARRLREVIAGRALLFINERVDVALVSGVDGVQLGESGLSPRDVREIGGESLLVGRSVHDATGALAARQDGADFVIAGNVYVTRSKPGLEGRGPELIREVSDAGGLPTVAVGGITPDRVVELVRAGAHGIAVISGILAADDPEQAARAYRQPLGGE